MPAARILTNHHAWMPWGEVAIANEALARQQREADWRREQLPGLVALTSAAFALDAL